MAACTIGAFDGSWGFGFWCLLEKGKQLFPVHLLHATQDFIHCYITSFPMASFPSLEA